MVRKVLLMSMNVGGGHTALRDAFATALDRVDPEGRRFAVERYESKDEGTLAFYTWVVRHLTPFQWVVHRFSDSELTLRLALSVRSSLVAEAKQLLRVQRPDVVVSAHLILSGAVVLARNELGLDTRVVTAIPDYGPPTAGFFPRLRSIRPDAAIAMEAQAFDAVRRRSHARADNVHRSGFLTRPPFEALAAQLGDRRRLPPDERRALAARLTSEHPQLAGYDPQRPTAIFLGGSAWTEKTLPVLEGVLADPSIAATTNLLVVAGKNPAFHARAAKLLAGHPTASLFGFVSPETMAGLVALADVPVLGSLAPATLHELLELRCGPLLLFHFIPGTELPHIDYLQDQRLGVYEPEAARMVERLREALGHAAPSSGLGALLDGFGENARRIRDDNRNRALQLGDFLESLLPPPARATLPPLNDGLRIAS